MVQLPLSGETLLTVVRQHDLTTASVDYLEHSVRFVEELMGEPLPRDHIRLHFETTGHWAVHLGTHIVMSSSLEGAWDEAKIIAHEVAHYYWGSFAANGELWVIEGVPEFIGYFSEQERTGTPIQAWLHTSCPSAKVLAEDDEGKCEYILGPLLFYGLYDALGEEAFRSALRSLYLKGLYDDPDDSCEGTHLDICHVEAAFKACVSDQLAAKVDDVLDRWYYSGPAPEEPETTCDVVAPDPESTPTSTTGPGPTSLDPITSLERVKGLDQDRPELALQIRALPWVADGIDDSERESAQMLIDNAWSFPDMSRALLIMPWVEDNEITRHEETAIKHLSWMTWTDDGRFQEAVVALLDMPFLDSIEFADSSAVRALYNIAADHPNVFLDIVSHPNVSDGITDQEAKVVAVLRSPVLFKPESVPVLLDGMDGSGGVYLEERVTQLPLTGETLLTVIRLRDTSPQPTMDHLEHSVRFMEEFVGESMPTNYIALYIDDALEENAAGHYMQSHLTIMSSYEGGAAHLIAHEVAHYYYHVGMRWIYEGVAVILAFVSERERYGKSIETEAWLHESCFASETLVELELIYPSGGDGRCEYILGPHLFYDLYDTLGDGAFRSALHSLYLKGLHDDPDDNCEGTHLDICHVEAAFKAGASEEVAAKVDEVLDRWYGPRP